MLYILGCFRHATIASKRNASEIAVLTTNGFNECHQMCIEDVNCEVFIWKRQTKVCKLYKSLSNAIVIEDLLSVMGPRDCTETREIRPEQRNSITSIEKSSTERWFNSTPDSEQWNCVAYKDRKPKLLLVWVPWIWPLLFLYDRSRETQPPNNLSAATHKALGKEPRWIIFFRNCIIISDWVCSKLIAGDLPPLKNILECFDLTGKINILLLVAMRNLIRIIWSDHFNCNKVSIPLCLLGQGWSKQSDLSFISLHSRCLILSIDTLSDWIWFILMCNYFHYQTVCKYFVLHLKDLG